MTANIYWRTIKKRKSLDVGAPSSFIKMFKDAFGMPTILNVDDHTQLLNGMRIGSEYHKEALEEIIAALEAHGEIEIYAEY